MKIEYELEHAKVQATSTKEGVLLAIREADATVKTVIDHDQAVQLRRSLARLTGISGNVEGHRYGIADLHGAKKALTMNALSREEAVAIIEAHIELIERINGGSDYAAES